MPCLLNRMNNPQGVCMITLGRPEALNALNTELLKQLVDALDDAQTDPAVRAVVLTGGNKVFAAGADIHEMAANDFIATLSDQRIACWQRISQFKKPLIAAVNGLALGAGCELVLHADIVIAGENARFGLPEINLGIMPGAGGTQRLPVVVGKSRAMQMVLTGEPIDAHQALQSGLVSEVTSVERTIERALHIAHSIACKAPIAVNLAKEAVLTASEANLACGLRLERKAFALLAATQDRQEGLKAFQEKREPHFIGR